MGITEVGYHSGRGAVEMKEMKGKHALCVRRVLPTHMTAALFVALSRMHSIPVCSFSCSSSDLKQEVVVQIVTPVKYKTPDM